MLINIWCASQRNASVQINETALKNILLQLLVEADQSSMVYQFPMINQTLCIV